MKQQLQSLFCYSLFCVLSALPSHANLVILPLGDSITQAEHGSTNHQSSYRAPLQTLLTNAGMTFDFIGSHNDFCGNVAPATPFPGFDPDHEGHWGWRADEILNGPDPTNHCDPFGGSDNLDTWISNYAMLPDIVLLHIGTNDILAAFSGGLSPAELSSINADIEAIVSKLETEILPTKPNLKILLAQLIPGTLIDTEVQAVNAEIVSIAMAHPSSVILVDQYTGFQPDTSMPNPMTYDEIHPNALGEQHMADRWFAGIQTATVPEPSSFILCLVLLVGHFRRK